MYQGLRGFRVWGLGFGFQGLGVRYKPISVTHWVLNSGVGQVCSYLFDFLGHTLGIETGFNTQTTPTPPKMHENPAGLLFKG